MAATIRYGVPLAPLTTFELGGSAAYFAEATSESELRELLREHGAQRPFVLGGGSNLVVDDEGYAGLVVKMGLRGIDYVEKGGVVWVTVAAGEPWDAFVADTVARNLAGLECLSGIPGSVGATPIQNVGAYGQEVGERIASVRAMSRVTGEVRDILPAECGFSYRHSHFKAAALADYVVTSVTFALVPGGAPSVRYAELAKALVDESSPSLARVREVVIGLRRSKSMVIDASSGSDPNRRSAGSFFMNPIVDKARADEVEARARAQGALATDQKMPRFPASNGTVKLAAAWLIERAGFHKGMRKGAVGISSAHALALVHHGGGTTRELWALAQEITDGVERAFGVRLSPEPVRLTNGDTPGALL